MRARPNTACAGPEGAPVSRYWSSVVEGLTPYVPGEQPKLPDLIKLNTNESPYGPSPRALAALRAEVGDTLRLYPDPDSDSLRHSIADFHKLKPAQVFVGNGSDEVLAHIFLALLKHEQPVLFPDITYSFYPVYCSLYGIAYRRVPLTQSFEIRVDDYFTPNGGIVFPNPNAPTGRPPRRCPGRCCRPRCCSGGRRSSWPRRRAYGPCRSRAARPPGLWRRPVSTRRGSTS